MSVDLAGNCLPIFRLFLPISPPFSTAISPRSSNGTSLDAAGSLSRAKSAKSHAHDTPLRTQTHGLLAARLSGQHRASMAKNPPLPHRLAFWGPLAMLMVCIIFMFIYVAGTHNSTRHLQHVANAICICISIAFCIV